jgi:hypothetical protein
MFRSRLCKIGHSEIHLLRKPSMNELALVHYWVDASGHLSLESKLIGGEK